jgi:fructose-1,6-bisphosphatase/inositol monophosphatase family enzyme
MHIDTITDLTDNVRTAGEMALDAQRDLNSLERGLKEDGSIVTLTDQRVEEYLYAEIARRYPQANILTEETARAFDARKPYTCFSHLKRRIESEI